MLQGLFLCILETGQARRGGGGGGTLLYKPYRYVPPPRVWFLRRFGLKTGIESAHFGLESDMVFERVTGGLNVFVVSIPVNKKERVICKFEMDIKKSFSWRSNISNEETIS